MASKLVSLIVGMVLGVGAAWLVLRQPAPHLEQAATPPPQATTAEGGAGNSELEAARKRIDELEATNLKLADRVQSLLRQTTPPATAGSTTSATPDASEDGDGAEDLLSVFTGGADKDPARRAAMKEMMATAVRQQVDGKLARMQERLNLTPEQAQQAREILESQFAVGLEMAEKAMTGKSSATDAQQVHEAVANPEEQLKALLTPEQQTGYAELQREERRNTARLMANSELLQMQGSLGLSEAQQDQAFRILAEQAEQQFGGDSGAMPSLDFRAGYTRKLEAMKQVLTTEQYERYAQLQEQQIKLIESMMPKNGSAGDVAVPQIQVLPTP